jgi:hypothetical protein
MNGSQEAVCHAIPDQQWPALHSSHPSYRQDLGVSTAHIDTSDFVCLPLSIVDLVAAISEETLYLDQLAQVGFPTVLVHLGTPFGFPQEHEAYFSYL